MIIIVIMSNIPGFTERVSPTGDHTTFDLTDMANILEYTASRLLAIHVVLKDSTLVTSAKVHHNVARYLMWEGEVCHYFLTTDPLTD